VPTSLPFVLRTSSVVCISSSRAPAMRVASGRFKADREAALESALGLGAD
jgi:hypothetical protein